MLSVKAHFAPAAVSLLSSSSNIIIFFLSLHFQTPLLEKHLLDELSSVTLISDTLSNEWN